MTDEETDLIELRLYIKKAEALEPIHVILKKLHMQESEVVPGFKKMYGESLFAFHRIERLLRAQKILRRDHLQIKQVAVMVGYKNIYTFSEAYKNHFGYSPIKDKGKA
jgi:AraC-like DNA-binding protein